MAEVDKILAKLAELVQSQRFEELETDGLEIKPVPATGGEWKERYKTVNAFLNTRGGILVLGIKEEGKGPQRRYSLTGWQSDAEPKLKDFPTRFTDAHGNIQFLGDRFPPAQIRSFLHGRVALVYVDELAADRKFVFFEGTAYKRNLTGDHKIPESEVASQEEFKTEAVHARELQPVSGLIVNDLDLTKLNHFIYQLNQPVQVETIKPDVTSAIPFLERRSFLKNGQVTVLGALVCASHPNDSLGFRSHVHGYVDLPAQTDADSTEVVQDKQDFIDNVLQLMESTFGYLLRNIQIGVSATLGGSIHSQYPQAVLRETVNNALAHRDYSINRQVIVAIRPGRHISIQNPGTFRQQLIIELPDHSIPLRRIVPEAKPRNPKLADVLRVYRKWEGRGIGMATLVNLSLQNQIGLPYYRLLSEEVRLYLQAGKLLDERMERLFESFDGHIQSKLYGAPLNQEQKLVLSYLIKSEWANRSLGYTILLTPDNNHFEALRTLESSGLVFKHPASSTIYPIFVADRVLVTSDFNAQLREIFGIGIEALDQQDRKILGVVYRYNNFNKSRLVSAKQTSYTLWYEQERDPGDIKEFDTYYRKVRRAFNRLQENGYVQKATGTRGYVLNLDYLKTHLL